MVTLEEVDQRLKKIEIIIGKMADFYANHPRESVRANFTADEKTAITDVKLTKDALEAKT